MLEVKGPQGDQKFCANFSTASKLLTFGLPGCISKSSYRAHVGDKFWTSKILRQIL